jgi:O-methyltransferase
MTKALAIAADLGIAQALSDGPRPVAELARDSGVDRDALHRVLRGLASDGVFVEEEDGVFGNNPTSQLLLGTGWSEFAHLFGDVFYRAVSELDGAVRTGAPTFARTFGTEFWPWLAAHPPERVVFDRAMSGGKNRSAERLAELDWEAGEVIVDVGGGNGTLLSELLRRRPGLRGVVLDLPETDRDEDALGPNIEFVEGSFFERVPEGDAYVLSGIIHDWGDDEATTILRKIGEAARPNARVLIAESVISPGNEPEGAKWLDLLMLVLGGGRERTESQWQALLESSGLVPVRIDDGLIEARCP